MSESEGYRDGWPEKVGWYDCEVDGEELRLRHWICSISGRHEWIRPDGSYVPKAKAVRWYGDGDVRI